jgi:putative membrane protein
MWNGWGLGMMWGWWLFGLVLVVGLVLLAVLLVRVLGGGVDRGTGAHTGQAERRSSARDILDERYARGEMGTEEYQERRRAIDDG